MTMAEEHEWQDERRRADSLMLGIMNDIRADLKSMRETLAEHIAEEPKLISEALARGFPDGDPEGHRKVHEAYIKSAMERADFWKRMTYEITRYGLIGFIAWASYQLWVAFLHGPKS